MDVYTTEEQQVEAIKTWWRDNGKAVVLGAIIGLGALYGWRYYQSAQTTGQAQASQSYTQVLDALATDSEQAVQQAERFLAANPKGYGELLALQLAKTQVDAGQLEQAAATLNKVQQSKDPILGAVANLRAARIEFSLQAYDKALATLNNVQGDSWRAQVDALRGDIKLAQGDKTAARAAYAASLAVAANPVVQMKLDNLAQ